MENAKPRVDVRGRVVVTRLPFFEELEVVRSLFVATGGVRRGSKAKWRGRRSRLVSGGAAIRSKAFCSSCKASAGTNAVCA